MDRGSGGGARAAFELLEPEYGNYRRMKVTLNRSPLKKAQTADDLACVSSDDKAYKTQKFLAFLPTGVVIMASRP